MLDTSDLLRDMQERLEAARKRKNAERSRAYLCVDAVTVALCMAELKIARAATNETHMDSWVDLAGYAACGGEIASYDKE